MKEEASVKKIVVIGPESTGKSTLCKQLAEHFKTLWCPEFAREYLLSHGKDYTYDDLFTIAKGQLQLEDEYAWKIRSMKYEVRAIERKKRKLGIGDLELSNENSKQETRNRKLETADYKSQTTNYKLLFIDTDMYVMKVWCEYVFGECHQFILDQIAERNYDLYLLCNTDLPWVSDELREYPEEAPRKELYQIYKSILINQQTPWIEISGDYNDRLQKAIDAVEKYVL